MDRVARRTRQVGQGLGRALLGTLITCLTAGAIAQAETSIRPEPVLGPAEEAVIQYEAPEGLNDIVTRIGDRLAAKSARLEYEPTHGYLISALQLLNIPVSSQTLVFSKTSSQSPHTSPQTPRALYFNDQAYVGWVQGGDSMDVIAVDPRKGPIFYTLDQRPEASPHFVRRNECLTQCHLGPKTLNVPGLFIRSAVTSAQGRPLDEIRDFVPGHNSPLEKRWAGWYVTGTHEGDRHLGNTWRNPIQTEIAALSSNRTNLLSLVETKNYLSPHSDTVALMVLDHIVRMQNLITQAGYETRLARGIPGASTADAPQRIARAGEALLAYLLFRDEAPLHGRVTGTSGFAQEFSRTGPRDPAGRSLRDFDLQHRLFRYPCSFLIYSESFDQLPEEMKSYVYTRLRQILDGKDHTAMYASLTDTDRAAVQEILLATKPEFKTAPAKLDSPKDNGL